MRVTAASLVVIAFLGSLPAAAQTQLGPRVEAGHSWTQAGGMSGSGPQASAVIPLPIRVPYATVTTTAFGHLGSANGSPLQCELAVWSSCLGRAERVRLGGVGLGLESGITAGSVQLSARAQLGAYAEHLSATEIEGPVGTCLVSGQVAPCEPAAPWQERSMTRSGIGPGYGWGLGVSRNLRFGRLWFEVMAQQYRANGRPTEVLTVGAGLGRRSQRP